MLHEHIDTIDLSCALFSFLGVICVLRPGFLFGYDGTQEVHGSIYAVIAGLLAAFCQAVFYVTVRKINALNFLAITNYFLLTSTVLSGLWVVIFNKVLDYIAIIFPNTEYKLLGPML